MRRLGLPALALVLAALAVPGAARAADPEPVLTLSANRPVYVAGQTATFTSHVEAMNLNWYLQVRFPGSAEWKTPCFNLNVNTDTFHCEIGMYYNLAVRVVLSDAHGTEDTADDTVVKMVNLGVGTRASIGTAYYGYFVKSGGYAVFGKGAHPKFATVSQPAFPGQRCLRHQVQRKYASGWRTVKTSACLVEKKQGRVDWTWTGKHPSKVKFRVRGTFAGDTVNRPNQATWLYFKFR